MRRPGGPISTQEYIPAGMTMGEEATGRVWLAWPDRALFHTGEPPFRLMGLQGRTVRLVDLHDETCDERTLSDREWERVPLAAVLDPRGALVHFDVVDRADNEIVLIPKEPGGVDRVEVDLGEDDLPDEVTIWDPQGAVNRLRLLRLEDGEGTTRRRLASGAARRRRMCRRIRVPWTEPARPGNGGTRRRPNAVASRSVRRCDRSESESSRQSGTASAASRHPAATIPDLRTQAPRAGSDRVILRGL